MIKLIIFDYDGVLFDTKRLAFNIVKKCCKKFLRHSISEHEFIEIYKSNFYDAMRKHHASRKKVDEIKTYALDLLKDKKQEVHAGIKSAVQKLSKTHTIAIISSNYDEIMKENLQRSGILGNFDFIMGVEEGESKLKKIRSLLKKTKTKKTEAVFITDTVGDIKEANKAGVKTMAVTWGFHPKQMLREANPDFIVEKSKQIQEVML